MKEQKPVESKLYTKEYYANDNEGGKVFIESGGRKASYRFIKFMKLAQIDNAKRVLDIGCGRGEIVVQCALKGISAEGIDYSSDGIAVCNSIKRTFPKDIQARMNFSKKDAKDISYPDNYFDRVFMLDVVEHLHCWELDIALKKINKCMRKGGILIIHTTPNTDFYKYGYPIIRIAYPFLSPLFPSIRKLVNTKPNWKNKRFLPKDPEEGQVYNKEGHINEQNPISLRSTLKKAGFKTKIILVPFTRQVKGPIIQLVYGLLSLPLIRKIFCAEIIAVCKK